MKEDKQSLGIRLESLIKVLNLKKGDFANNAGISQSLISNIIKGKNGASKATINLICRTYNVSNEWLINGHLPMFNEKSDSGLAPLVIREIFELYDKLIPETQKEIREYIKKMYELQELRKKAGIDKETSHEPEIEDLKQAENGMITASQGPSDEEKVNTYQETKETPQKVEKDVFSQSNPKANLTGKKLA